MTPERGPVGGKKSLGRWSVITSNTKYKSERVDAQTLHFLTLGGPLAITSLYELSLQFLLYSKTAEWSSEYSLTHNAV